MINEELENYTEDGSSTLNNGESYGSDLGYEDDEDFVRYRKDMIFQNIDFTKHKTKIGCTVGPATETVPDIIKLIDAGMSIARFNMSHGKPKDNARMIRKFFEARKLRPYKTCAMVLDVRGREIRCCPRTEPAEGVQFEMGLTAKIRSDGFAAGQSTVDIIQVDNVNLPKAVRPGDNISFEEGKLNAVVLETDVDEVKIQFKNSATLYGGKQVIIPANRLAQLPILQSEDKNDILSIAVKNKFDYICVPNITSVKDVQEIKYARTDSGSNIGILAKIDNLEAVHQFEGILKYADGVIVLRNELAYELPPEKLMLAQKWMIQTANLAAVPIFLQSQVLESMIDQNFGLARQEAQDVSVAVLDGADGFILSHETSMGKYPLEATVLLAKAISEAEQIFDHEQAFQDARNATQEQGRNANSIDVLASTATQIALDNNVDLLVCLTKTGRVARYLVRQKPEQIVLACSELSHVVRQVNCSRGVLGYKIPGYLQQHMEQLISLILKVAKEQGYCFPGNKVMIFTVENEGAANETAAFRMIDIDEE